MKVLCVGDLHLQEKDLVGAEIYRFMRGMPTLAREHGCTYILFMGDIGHTHATLNSYVQKFLSDQIEEYGQEQGLDFGFIIGNHDQAGTAHPNVHTLSSMLRGRAKNIDIFSGVTAIPEMNAVFAAYHHNNEEFVKRVEEARAENATLFCHQTFAGACYDNKFLAAGGVDAKLLGFKHIVAGHIHMRQGFGNVRYVGTPRWTTASDYNEDKSLCVFDTNTGEMDLIPASMFFRPWRRFFERENDTTNLAETIAAFPENEVVIEGSPEFVAARAAYYAQIGIRHRTKVTGKRVAVSVNSGKAINDLLSDYVEKADMKNQSPRAAVRQTIGGYL